MAAGDLTSVANVQAQAGMSAAAAAVVQSLITQASAYIAKQTDQSFAAVASYSEIRDGSGGTELYLANPPVATITSLTIDGTAIPAQPADQVSGYFMAGELLCLFGYVFSRGRKNVRVSYTAGFAAVPKDIEQACIELVVSAYRRVPRGVDLVSEHVPANGMNVTWSLKDVPSYAKEVLDNYRKVVPL